MNNLPPLPALRVFDAVARHLSFTKAAGDLAMTQSAVSYQIKLLEAFVSETLFQRLPRGIALTPRGAQLAPVVRNSLSTLAIAFASARDAAASLLVITTIHTFATNWLAPRIGSFQLAHGDLAVRIDMSAKALDLAAGEADVAIRSGRGPWDGCKSHLLMPIRFAPFASPAFIERYGRPNDPAALLDLPLVGPDDEWWPIWFAEAKAGDGKVPPQRGLLSDRQQIIGTAVLAGQGIGLLTRFLYADEIRAGRLVQMFDIVSSSDHALHLVYPEANASRPKIRAFRDWLLAEMKPIAAEGW